MVNNDTTNNITVTSEWTTEGNTGTEATKWKTGFFVLWNVLPPIILIVGTVGNVIAILVLRRMSRNGSSFALFFGALAVSDLAVLWLTLLRKWLAKAFGVHLDDLHDAPCKLYYWVGYSAGMLSAWFLTAATVQRALSVAWPHRMKRSCTRRESYIAIGTLTAVSFALNFYSLFAVALDEEGECGFLEDFELNVQPVLAWIELLVYSLLPASIIIVSNCLLIHKFFESEERVKVRSSGEIRRHASISSEGGRSRVTLTLIVVSLVFLLLTLPLGIMQIPSQRNPELFKDDSFVFWRSCTAVLWYANSAVNFYLYLITGSKFREELRKLLRAKGGTETKIRSTDF